MKIKLRFHSFETINWKSFSVILAGMTAFVIGIQSIIPEWLFHKTFVIISALQAAITLFMRTGKTWNGEERRLMGDLPETPALTIKAGNEPDLGMDANEKEPL